MATLQGYADFSSIAEIDQDGGIRLLTGHEAVENALRLWIASFRGELLRNPGKRWIYYSMAYKTYVS
jgi:hypothetical protein